MARKINFDPPAADALPPREELHEAAPQRSRPLLGLERSIKQSSALGAISQSLGGISEKVKRAEEIEQKLIEGQVIVDLDPALIDNSFVPDRMDATEEQNAAFRELIRQHGQNVPILVRPKPGDTEALRGRFRSSPPARGSRTRHKGAGGGSLPHRRATRHRTGPGEQRAHRSDFHRACALCGAARGPEIFPRNHHGLAQRRQGRALATYCDRDPVPAAVIDAIGPAPAFGRVRWQELTDLLEREDNRARALEMVKAPTFGAWDTDKRFEALADGLREKSSRARAETWSAKDGTHAAKVSRAGKKLTLTFDDRAAPRFGDFVRDRLQTLYDEFKAGDPPA